MKTVKIAAVCAALVALSASEASAQQSGYVFLQCDYTGTYAGSDPRQYRIGNGRWDVLADGAWHFWGESECGGERTTAVGTGQSRCTFAENEYRMVASTYGQFPSTFIHTISRITGRYQLSVRTPDGRADEDLTAQCRPIAEPKTAERLF
ncbi:hypothetical protein [Caulobacter henricii]|uniref:Uncharacterized protein n=1 Tax=Caulobacter henricii TaxID=69395 RepID=A0A0N7JHS1_9CAUL|nr:hypothetical protein [Caulobacter henricii]ALL14178.1 hypothetical protein AQ619_12980 [Caulobacter henricii]